MRNLILTGACSLLSACANLNPHLESDPANPAKDGLRYYMTRPFVVVHKPYPIQADAFVVHGTMSADGKYVVLSNLPQALIDLVPAVGSTDVRIPVTRILSGPSGQGVDSAGSRNVGGTAQSAESGKDVLEEDQGSDSTPSKKASEAISMSNVTVTTDLSALAVIPVNDAFSIAFLPDYEREFIVSTKAKLGITRMVLNHGPGGTLLGMSAEVDNSQVAEMLFSTISDVVTAGSSRVVGLIGKTASSGTAQSEERMNATAEMKGVPVTLRAHVIKMAAIGAYPIVKPHEVDCTKGAAELLRHCYKNVDGATRKYLVPVEAYQVPYDYNEVVLFEHVLDTTPGYLFSVTSTPQSKKSAQASCEGAVPADKLDSVIHDVTKKVPPAVAPLLTADRFELVPMQSGLPCHQAITFAFTGTEEESGKAEQAVMAAMKALYSEVAVTWRREEP